MMKQTKIYLAKSNLANPDDVMFVRNVLQTRGLEVVEFQGGQYSHIPLLECDKLIIVPKRRNYFSDPIILGKGLEGQVIAFEKILEQGKENMYIFDVKNDNLMQFSLSDLTDYKDSPLRNVWTDSSKIETKDKVFFDFDYLFPRTQKTKLSFRDNKYRYLLIK